MCWQNPQSIISFNMVPCLQDISVEGLDDQEPSALSWGNWRQRQSGDGWKQPPGAGGGPFGERLLNQCLPCKRQTQRFRREFLETGHQ